MTIPSRFWRCFPARVLGGVGLSLALMTELDLPAAELEPVLAEAPAAVVPQNGPVLSLAECIHFALDHQPAIAAQRASLSAAAAAFRQVEQTRIPTFIVHELPMRRKQAALGLRVATAGLELAERETIYAVTRTYATVLYAHMQEAVAKEVVGQLDQTHSTGAAIAEREKMKVKPRVTKMHLDKIAVVIQIAKTRQAQASLGTERALAALREAIGLEPGCCLKLAADEKLPKLNFQLCRADLVNLALTRRGELVQASSAAEVIALEVEAQGTTARPKMQTFAALSDLHARPVPQGISNSDYRPAAVGLEMPANLAGSRSARVELAKNFHLRALAVVDKTRNLIALETEDAFLKWQEASRKVKQLEPAVPTAEKLADLTEERWSGDQNVTVEEVLTNRILAGQTKAQLNENLFQQVLELAALERITAGGFCPGLASPPDRPPPTTNESQERNGG